MLTNDKLALLTAGLLHVARAAKMDDLIQYIEHPSQHSDAFINEVEAHLKNLGDVDEFASQHAALTQPGGESRSYTRSEVDEMVRQSIQRAVSEAQSTREQTFTRSEMQDEISRAVAAALDKYHKDQAAKGGAS